MGWIVQTEKAQLDAIEWFVTTFPPSIQERVRTFLKGPSARYLEGLEIEVQAPEQNQGPEIEARRASGYYDRKHWQENVNDAELRCVRRACVRMVNCISSTCAYGQLQYGFVADVGIAFIREMINKKTKQSNTVRLALHYVTLHNPP